MDNEDHDPPASSSTSGSGDNANTNGSGGTGGDSQFTPQSPPAAVSPAPAPAPEPAPAPAPAPDVEPSPDPQAEQPSFTLPNYVAPGGDKGIEADPVFFLIDDAAEAAILALLLSAIMATIISEYGWEWVRTHPDQLPDLMIDKLPGWLADQVDKVKDWISQYFTKNNEPGDGNSADVPHPEWGSGNHTNQLPTSGDVPYVPPRNIQRNPDGSPVPNNGSFPDKKGRIWTWDESGHGGEHWDVTDPKTGKHVNVYPNGHTR
ncbi:hypothetical protein GYA93_15655 [Gordonia desulfuricans]|uniref:Bacterial toxin 37 domain-containing protein n=1 Tax=Gordonia desulfuricans TaxID=89051 RepID=A0A7K3LTW2_9ACTN|nr:hypothetical protein [Gordonia desulfuricans]NDK91007.1 hypothetical protein [Gordonia desulfuricans]